MTEIKLMKLFDFKNENIKTEFLSDKMDYRLQIILYALAGFTYWSFGKGITITELLRTKEMQDEYYKDDPIYQHTPFHSTHEYWRAADISIKYFTQEEINSIMAYLKHFEYGDKHTTYLVHDIGLGTHLHLQVSSQNYTLIKTSQ